MKKSEKRLKLENEIFSKSIKDIEKMFNFSHISGKNNTKAGVNLSFLSDPLGKNHPPPIILPSSKPPVISSFNRLNFEFDDDDGDYDLPTQINLERDLQLIDELILQNHKTY